MGIGNKHLYGKKIILFLFLFLASTPFAWSREKSKILPLPPSIRDSIPWFALREMAPHNPPFTRQHLQLEAEKSNRTILVYFATWCLPCRAGILDLIRHQKDLEQSKIKVILVNLGEKDEETIEKWKKEMGIPGWKILLDPFGRTTEGFGLIQEGTRMDLPKTLILDKNLKPLLLIGEEGEDYRTLLKDGL